MKKILFPAVLLICCAAFAGERDAAQSFSVNWYGSFRKIIQGKDLGGVVPLERALSGPHIYALGMISDAAGEVTVVDGDVSLNYGKDGIGNAASEIKKGEESSLLVTASVGKWRTVPVPENMSEGELHAFVLEEARRAGISTREPFPFLIEGTIEKLVWSVLDGTDPELTRQTHQLFFRKLVGYRAETPAVLIGFYPAELQSELAWPGEFWHVHVLFKNEKTTGHVNAFSVEKGAILSLPAREQRPYGDKARAAVKVFRTGTLP
ncbi:MAG: acetolactate decarboxylase [Acidobacteriota bacterium]